MAEFTGNYSGTFDGRKARLSVPADFRAELAKADSTELVLRQSGQHAAALEVWPRRAFLDHVKQRVAGKDPFEAEYEERGGSLVEDIWNLRIDAEGRIVLPRDLLDEVPLEADLRFTGRMDFFLIWPATAHAAYRAARGKPRPAAGPGPRFDA
jgi:DNA-binding transcriptional regulator/RsmH inhibitor MraZ